MAKKGYKAEYERKRMLEKVGYRVYRVSGSIGAGDLLVVRKKERGCYEVFIEQVKSVRSNIFYFDRKSKDEWRRLLLEDIPSYFVIRFNHKNRVYWRRVKVKGDPPKKITLRADSRQGCGEGVLPRP